MGEAKHVKYSQHAEEGMPSQESLVKRKEFMPMPSLVKKKEGCHGWLGGREEGKPFQSG
jgi:hypothetical protein